MNAAIRKAIARIDVIHQEANVSRGTGSLIGSRFVLTALHVVANRQAMPPMPHPGRIHLTFPGHTTEAVIHQDSYDVQSDWVLLECAEPPPAPPIPLGELNESGGGFETFGFPDIQPIDGMVQRGTVENHDAQLFGAEAFQLFSNQAAAGDGAPIQGSSGSPVIVDNALVGVLRAALLTQQKMTRAGTLYACPLSAVLDQCGDLLPVPDPCRGLPGLRRQPLPPRPFTYLSRFTATEAEIFFGRNRDIRQLYGRLTAEGAAPLVLLYGQAGVGKSSFLEAAVLPRLEWTHAVRYARRERRESLLETVLREVDAGDGSPTSDLDARWRRVEEKTGRPFVLILDQIEEVFTQPRERTGELPELITALAKLFANRHINPQSRVVLSFRKEWFPEIQKALEDSSLSYGKVFLDRLDRDSLIEVVTGLTRTRRLRDHYGLHVDARLPDLIADDLQEDRDSPIAPTLRILLSKMWEQATARNRSAPAFTVVDYHELKRKGVLLGDFLDQQIDRLAHDRPADVASGFVIDVLAFHTSSLLTAQQRSTEELKDRYRHRERELPFLLQDMKRQWLLVDPAGDEEAHARATRLSHDTLAPLVRQRFDESDRPGQRARRIVESRAADWRDERDGTPLDAADLEIVERGLTGMRAPDTSETRLLEASRIRRKKELQRWWLLRIASVAAIALIAVSAVVSMRSAARAERERRRAVSAARTVQAREALESDPALAAQIFAEIQGYPEPADGGRTARLVLNEHIPLAIFRGHRAPIRTVAFSPDGQHVVSASEDGTARVWLVENTADPLELDHRAVRNETLQGDPGYVLGGIYDPAGTNIATFSLDGKARLWRNDGTPVLTLPHEDAVTSAAFNKAGTLLLTTTARSAAAQIWNVGTGTVLHSLWHPASVVKAEFGPTPGPEQILTVAGGQLRVWTLRRDDHPVELVIPVSAGVSISAATFSADGTLIAVGSRDGRVRLLSAGVTGSPGPTLEPPADAGPVRAIRVSPDGRQFAVVWNNAVRLWDPAEERQLPIDHPNDVEIRQVIFSSNGMFMATSSGNRVWVWSRTPSRVVLHTELRGHSDRVESIDFSRDGRFVATGSSDHTARVWRTDAVEPELITRFRPDSRVTFDSRGEHAVILRDKGPLNLWQVASKTETELSAAPVMGTVKEVGVSPTGSHVLAISQDGHMSVWPTRGPGQLMSIRECSRIATAAFVPDGSSVKVIDADGRIHEWRIDTPWPDCAETIANQQVKGAVLSLNGARLLTTTDNTAILASARDGSRMAELRSAAPITSRALSSNGSHVFTGSIAGADVWDVSSVPTQRSPTPMRLPRAGDTAAFAMFNRDASRVLVLDVLGAAHVFSSDGTNTPIGLTDEKLQAATFDAEGSHVFGVTIDGRMLRWRIGWEALIASLESATTSCLTTQQRMQFFGEQLQEAGTASQNCEGRKRNRRKGGTNENR